MLAVTTIRKLAESEVLRPELAHSLLLFCESYNAEKDLVQRLGLIYDFFDEAKEDLPPARVVLSLCQLFTNEGLHQSEMKTVLVISKGMKDHPVVKDARQELLQLYDEAGR